MPSADMILDMLAGTARAAWPVAAIWHVLLAAALLAASAGWRPSQRLAALLMMLPIVSAAVVAAVFGNFFNAILLGLGAGLLVFGSRWLPTSGVVVARHFDAFAGALLVAFGWVYPHFVDPVNVLAYVYVAPFGVLPCPTLAAVIGLVLLAGFGFRPWAGMLAALGLFYGAFGVFRLGVLLDIVLLVGASAVILRALFTRRLDARAVGRHPKVGGTSAGA